MATLGELQGEGWVEAAGARQTVRYRLIVRQDAGKKSAAGTLRFAAPSGAFAAFNADEAMLELADGRRARIVIVHVGGADAEFMLSGPLAGF